VPVYLKQHSFIGHHWPLVQNVTVQIIAWLPNLNCTKKIKLQDKIHDWDKHLLVEDRDKVVLTKARSHKNNTFGTQDLFGNRKKKKKKKKSALL
jgi:hypothetical protein